MKKNLFQGYFMEILMTFLAEVDFAFNERPKSVLEQIDASKRTSSLQDLNSESIQERTEVMLDNAVEGLAGKMSVPNQHYRSLSYDVDYSHSAAVRNEGKKKDRR